MYTETAKTSSEDGVALRSWFHFQVAHLFIYQVQTYWKPRQNLLGYEIWNNF